MLSGPGFGHLQPEIVDCNVTGSPDLEEDQSGKEPGNGDSPKPKAISYISITLSNGVKVEHRRLGYPELLTFIRLITRRRLLSHLHVMTI